MATPNLITSRCPSCGAPISVGPISGTCQYCNTIVERAVAVALPAPSPVSRPRIAAVVATPRRSPQRWARITLLWVTLFVIIGGLYAHRVYNFPSFSSTLALHNDLNAELNATRPAATSTSNFVVYYADEQNDFSIGLVNSTSGEQRWKSAPFSKNIRAGGLTVGTDAVYVTDKAHLYALRLKDGTLLWQTALAADVAHECVGCLAVVGTHIAALQKDGSLYVYDTQHGQLAWKTQLESSPSKLALVGDTFVVPQPTIDNQGSTLRVLDAGDGSVVAQITPRCAGEHAAFDAVFNANGLLLSAADGTTFYTFMGSVNTCVQRWTIGKQTPDWQQRLDGPIWIFTTGKDSIKLSDTTLLVSQNSEIVAIDTVTGDKRNILHDKQYAITALFARDGVLVVDATPTWDTSKHALWGVDLHTGERLWDYNVVGEEWRGNQLFGDWDAHLTLAGIVVVQSPGGLHQLVVDQLDLKTGTRIGHQVTQLDTTYTQNIWDIFWSEHTAWLRIDQSTYVLDLDHASIIEKQ